MTLLEIVDKINDISMNGNHPFGELQSLRSKKYNYRPRAWKPFAKFSTFPNSGYAFHAGGMTELQFNIANEVSTGNGFRYGIAFSFQSTQAEPDPVKKLKPIVDKFNFFLKANPTFFYGYEMCLGDRVKNYPYSSKVISIKDDIIQRGNFIFIGKFIDKKQDDIDDADIETIVREFDYLYPAFEEIQFVLNVPENNNVDESTEYLIKSDPPKGIKELPKHNPSFVGVDDIDYVKKHREATELGRSGEDLVIKYEKEKLKRLGLEHLIGKVEKRKDVEGYDILSFDKDGNEILIEVKTTTGGIDTPFDISWNEVKRAEKDRLKYKIYRLYNFVKNSNSVPRFYVVDDIGSLLLEPVNYKAYWKEKEIAK